MIQTSARDANRQQTCVQFCFVHKNFFSFIFLTVSENVSKWRSECWTQTLNFSSYFHLKNSLCVRQMGIIKQRWYVPSIVPIASNDQIYLHKCTERPSVRKAKVNLTICRRCVEMLVRPFTLCPKKIVCEFFCVNFSTHRFDVCVWIEATSISE